MGGFAITIIYRKNRTIKNFFSAFFFPSELFFVHAARRFIQPQRRPGPEQELFSFRA
jgi:hypothetical protein